MPQKPNLRKKIENLPNCPTNAQQNNSKCEQSSDTSTISKELEQQFELELCWCIQQLQNALKSGKLNKKQVQDHTKALNTLMNNSSPMIKKRQVMRLSFGDYRAKMAAEEKKRSKSSLNMKVKPSVPNKKSVFIKKSTFTSSDGNIFRFNFQTSEENDISNIISCIKIDTENSNDSKGDPIKTVDKSFCCFVPSDNSFKFNFNSDQVL